MQEVQEVQVWSLGWEDHLEKAMATLSRILAWEISWTKKPGRLQVEKSSTRLGDWTAIFRKSINLRVNMGFLYWICAWILGSSAQEQDLNGKQDSGQHQHVGNHRGEVNPDECEWRWKRTKDRSLWMIVLLIQAEKEKGAENKSKEVQRNRSTERA